MAQARRSTATGIAFDVLIPGSFYQGVTPGGFSDSLTGIHVPGPKAELDGSTRREIVRLTELPEPIQLPHYKLISELSDGGKTRKEVEVDFNANDETPTHEGFQLALATGVIRMVPDEVMEEKYPETWAARKDKIVFRTGETKNEKSPLELMREAEERNDLARFAQGVKVAEVERVAALDAPRATTPPLPPPKKK